MKISLLIFSLLLLSVQSFSQCPGCTISYNTNRAITPTANNQTFCITGGTSYSFSSSTFRNVTLKVCAANVTITSFESSNTALNNKLEIRANGVTVSWFSSGADTTKLITFGTGTKVTIGTSNKKIWFETKDAAGLTVTNDLTPNDKIFFNVGTNSTVNTAALTSNQGGYLRVGRGATYKSSGEVSIQNNGYIYNEGLFEAVELKVQGGTNALMNICGESVIKVTGTMTFNSGSTHNEGAITMAKMWVNTGPLIFPKKGSSITATTLEVMNQTNFFRGDTMTAGQCSLFRITTINGWNNNLANSSRINYCGPASTKLGSATATCTCNSAARICGPVLPLDLISFDGSYTGTSVAISWQLPEISNASWFVLEKAYKGTEFHPIDTVRKSGSNYFTLFDDNVKEGLAYYRLKQYDYTGNFAGSEIISVDIPAKSIMIFPNPANGKVIRITGSTDQPSFLEIFSPLGQKVYADESASSVFEVNDLDFLENGIYLVKVISGAEVSYGRLYLN